MMMGEVLMRIDLLIKDDAAIANNVSGDGHDGSDNKHGVNRP